MVTQHVGFWGHLGNFFYSNLFIAAITLLVGLIAFRIYARQKRDTKRDAANIILLEIEDAERQLDKISQDNPFVPAEQETIYLMKNASWDKSKYLFVRDFDRNEWDKITSFYRKCQAYDEAVTFDRTAKENNQQQVRANLQRILTNHTKAFVDELEVLSEDPSKTDEVKSTETKVIEKRYWEKREAYIEMAVGEKGKIFTYVPKQAEFDAKKALGNLEGSLTLTSVGTKLKTIAHSQSIWDKVLGLFKRSQVPQ